MPYRRAVTLAFPIDTNALTSQLVGIGMNLAASPTDDPNIENTILFASIEGMENRDLRVLALLLTWFGIHSSWVNADRLTKLVAAESSVRVQALWSALARWQKQDRRFARLAALYAGARQDVIETGTDYHLRRHGEDLRFKGSPIRVARNVLRDRPGDVLPASALARRHRAYRYRIMMGPNYRADMWAALEADPTLSAAALARKTYGSFATAWHVHRDFWLLESSPGKTRLSEPRKKPARPASDSIRRA